MSFNNRHRSPYHYPMQKKQGFKLDVSQVVDTALNDLERIELEFAIETANFGGITGKATAFIKRNDGEG